MNGSNSERYNFDLHDLVKLRKYYEINPNIGYLNINHLSIKVDYPREICSKSPIDILCTDERKLDSSYPEAQFEIPVYQYSPYREDRNKNGIGKIVFIMEDLITKRLKAFEGDISKTICLEDMISKKVWFIDLHRVKLKAFFSRKYENIIIIGDLNIDTENKRKDNSNYLSDLFDIFSLKN